jgi:hypothetical protein
MFERLRQRVHTPSFDGATEWLNSEPLGLAEPRGRVVVVEPVAEASGFTFG